MNKKIKMLSISFDISKLYESQKNGSNIKINYTKSTVLCRDCDKAELEVGELLAIRK